MHFEPNPGTPQTVAVVGGGIAGLATAWLLSRRHRVTVFEAAPRLGGHARTVVAGRRGDRPVDTGFIVFNYATYPHLTALFRDLDVPVERSDMSFGVSLGGGRLEYALRSPGALFGQRRNALSPGFHGMIRDVLRFNAGAEALAARRPEATIASLIDEMRLGRRFREHYLFPICGAIWSTPADRIGGFPAQALLRFMRNHALMSKGGQHQWWTVSGGSVAYVDRLTAALKGAGADLRIGAPVRSVTRDEAGVRVRPEGGTPETFDQVVIAAHSDQALTMLADASEAEREALGAIRFQPNRAVLHRDPSVMPNRRRCWSSWVYRSEADTTAERAVGVSYWMNRLQNIPDDDPLFVTLNPDGDISAEAIYDETLFQHPLFDRAALAAQARIAGLQGRRRTWFAGAWLRNGFHEDGFASAVRIARRLAPERVGP